MAPKKERKWSKELVVGFEKRGRVSIEGKRNTYSAVVDRVGCVVIIMIAFIIPLGERM